METKAKLLASQIAKYYGVDDSVTVGDWYVETAKINDYRLWEWILTHPDEFDAMRYLYFNAKMIFDKYVF